MTKLDASMLRPQITSGKLLAERLSKDFIKPLKTPSTPKASAMASRRLALNLSQGLRNRAGLSAAGALRRGFATPSTVGKTQTTTLKNGLTVRILITGRPAPIGLAWHRVGSLTD